MRRKQLPGSGYSQKRIQPERKAKQRKQPSSSKTKYQSWGVISIRASRKRVCCHRHIYFEEFLIIWTPSSRYWNLPSNRRKKIRSILPPSSSWQSITDLSSVIDMVIEYKTQHETPIVSESCSTFDKWTDDNASESEADFLEPPELEGQLEEWHVAIAAYQNHLMAPRYRRRREKRRQEPLISTVPLTTENEHINHNDQEVKQFSQYFLQ